MSLPPFLFQAEENLVEKAWGGNWIQSLKGLKIDKKIGESWEFSAHPSKPSFISINGHKINLIELIKKYKREILGEIKSDNMPILVKLLDINRKISIQVHPSDDVARMLGEKECGKDEAWVVIGEGKIYVGFSEDVIKEDLLKGSIIKKINKFDAENLDTFKIPAGTIHFAEKAKILEVSTNSNITYRIFDFSGRETHIDKALKALNMRKADAGEIRGEKGKVMMDKFEVEVMKIDGEVEFEINSFNILFALEGNAKLKHKEMEAELRRGYSCLITASAKKYSVEARNALIAKICAGKYYL